MSESVTERHRGFSLAHVLVAVVALFAMYALSIGPVVRITIRRGDTMSATVLSFYSPLRWLCNHTPLGSPMSWYVDLWAKDQIPNNARVKAPSN